MEEAGAKEVDDRPAMASPASDQGPVPRSTETGAAAKKKTGGGRNTNDASKGNDS